MVIKITREEGWPTINGKNDKRRNMMTNSNLIGVDEWSRKRMTDDWWWKIEDENRRKNKKRKIKEQNNFR